MAIRSIVVLGGSYAGISTVHCLLRQHTSEEFQIILISSSTELLCRPAIPRAMIADEIFDQERLFVPIESVLRQYPHERVQFIHATVKTLNHESREVDVLLHKGGTRVFSYHSLVIATGSSASSALYGMGQDSESIRAEWRTFRCALEKASSIIVVGAGPTGVETAGEIGQHLKARINHSTRKTEILLITSADRILPNLPKTQSSKAARMLELLGVRIIASKKVQSVDISTEGTQLGPATITLDDGTKMAADVYIPATGTKPNTSFVASNLLIAGDRIDTNPRTLRVDRAGPRVYAIGDVSSVASPAIHHILAGIPVLCANIVKDLLLPGRAIDDREFHEDGTSTQLIPIGTRQGVGVFKGWSVPSVLVWLIKGRDYWLWTTGGLWSGSHWGKHS